MSRTVAHTSTLGTGQDTHIGAAPTLRLVRPPSHTPGSAAVACFARQAVRISVPFSTQRSSGRLWPLLTAAERPGGGSLAGQYHVSGLTLSSVVRQAALKTLAGQLTLFPAYLSLFFVWTGVLEVRARQAP